MNTLLASGPQTRLWNSTTNWFEELKRRAGAGR